MIIDSHCHLDYPNLYNQLDAVVNRAEQNQVKYLLTICTTLESFETFDSVINCAGKFYGTKLIYSKNEEDEGLGEIIVSKHRNGPTGLVKVSFMDKFARFMNLEYSDTEYQEIPS